MKDYASMSNFEVNKAVAERLGNSQVHGAINEIGGSAVSFVIYKNKGLNREGLIEMTPLSIQKDFCNNPADAWPIIISSMISVRPVGGDGHLWEASGMDGMKADYDKNPLRAAMIVFLMMKEGE